MKHIPILFLLIAAVNGYSQSRLHFATPLSPGILWMGTGNKVTIAGGAEYKNIFLKAEGVDFKKEENKFKQGGIEFVKDDETFSATVTTARANDTIFIDVCKARAKDTTKILSKKYVVKPLPTPAFSIGGKIISNAISKKALLKDKKIKVALGVLQLDTFFTFKLVSFDMEVEGKTFHSNSNSLTPEMIESISKTTSDSIRISNDNVWLKDGGVRYLYKDKTFLLEK